VVQGLAIGNIDKGAAAAEARKGGEFSTPSLSVDEQAQCSLDQLGHAAALTCGLALELGHEGIVDVEGDLHTINNTTDAVIWLAWCGGSAHARSLHHQSTDGHPVDSAR
jgi:hypothetical protein